MSFYKNFTSAIGVLAVAACLVSQAKAQSGSFTLPFEAHWGHAVLQPGQYKYSIPPATSWPQTIELTSGGDTVKLRAIWEAVVTEKKTSELLLTKSGDAAVITDLNCGPQGKTFHFLVAKNVRSELAKKGTSSTKIVTLVPANR